MSGLVERLAFTYTASNMFPDIGRTVDITVFTVDGFERSTSIDLPVVTVEKIRNMIRGAIAEQAEKIMKDTEPDEKDL